MAYVCQICGKGKVIGASQKHRRGVAGKRWKNKTQKTPRIFYPNLQKVSLKIGGAICQMRICTSCLKRIKKYGSVREYKNIALA